MNTTLDMTNSAASARIANMAAQLLGLLMTEAQSFSDPDEVAKASLIHDKRRAYPKLTVTMPHLGGAVRLELVLCDPQTDEPLVSVFAGEALATLAH